MNTAAATRQELQQGEHARIPTLDRDQRARIERDAYLGFGPSTRFAHA